MIKVRQILTADTHTRQEIIEEKVQVDRALASARAALNRAKRNAAASGTFLPVEEFERLEVRVSKLARKSQALQMELSRARDMRTGRRTFEQHFMDIARAAIGEQQMKTMIEEARARTSKETENADL